MKRLLMVRADEKVSMSLGGKKVDAREGRKEIMRIIEDFRREGEKRRSYVCRSKILREPNGRLDEIEN
jgi:hypothetical protein